MNRTTSTCKGIIALDLDGTLLNSNKELTAKNLAVLERAAAAGFEIVPTTGRFYGGMPQEIRELPFVRYTITINGAEAADLQTGEVIYRAELPWEQVVDMMSYFDEFPVIYDCYQGNEAFMTAEQKNRVEEMVASPHYHKMIRELRQPVLELKEFLVNRKKDVQKTQFFTNRPEVRAFLMEELPKRYSSQIVSRLQGNFRLIPFVGADIRVKKNWGM